MIHLVTGKNLQSNQNTVNNIETAVLGKLNGQRTNLIPSKAKVVGNYLLGKKIGQGAFGKVHLALHLPTQQKVAIKIVDKMMMSTKDIIRAKMEIANLSALHHRNIVQLYEIVETEKSLLMVTELLPNGELFEKILNDQQIPEREACAYFQQLLSAVEYMHRNGIVHRDLKPENILIDFDGQLKIIDFGLSLQYHPGQKLITSCGSPCYAAPEVLLMQSSPDPLLVDLWSCGVILFAMLCGQLPFYHTDTHLLLQQVLTSRVVIPHHISPAAKDLIQSLLEKEPAKRPSLSEIWNHEWLNLVQPSPAFGVDCSQRLEIDHCLVEKLRALSVQPDRLVASLTVGELTPDTATYFILMKKVVKAGEKSRFYFGSQEFDISLVVKQKLLCFQKTQTSSSEHEGKSLQQQALEEAVQIQNIMKKTKLVVKLRRVNIPKRQNYSALNSGIGKSPSTVLRPHNRKFQSISNDTEPQQLNNRQSFEGLIRKCG